MRSLTGVGAEKAVASLESAPEPDYAVLYERGYLDA